MSETEIVPMRELVTKAVAGAVSPFMEIIATLRSQLAEAERKVSTIYEFCERQLAECQQHALSPYHRGAEVTSLAVLATKHSTPAAPEAESEKEESRTVPPAPVLLPAEPPKNPDGPDAPSSTAAESGRDWNQLPKEIAAALVDLSYVQFHDREKARIAIEQVIGKPAPSQPAAAVEGTGEPVIPTADQNPSGLHQRYRVSNLNGETDPNAVYLVLRLDQGGSDPVWTKACRNAAIYLGQSVMNTHLHELGGDIQQTARRLGSPAPTPTVPAEPAAAVEGPPERFVAEDKFWADSDARLKAKAAPTPAVPAETKWEARRCTTYPGTVEFDDYRICKIGGLATQAEAEAAAAAIKKTI